jgi:ferritin-like metal-binding protein YciE
VAGIIDEGSEFIKNKDLDDAVRDAALIGSAQKVEHYEIATYGTARTWAQVLGLDEVADLLQQTLDEEAETDENLTSIAREINVEAENGAEQVAAQPTTRRRR